MENTKKCRLCGEDIKSTAKRCPNCQSWQSKWHVESNSMSTIVFSLLFYTVLLLFIFFKVTESDRYDFQDFASNFTFVENNLNFGTDNSGDFISVVGRIRNDTDLKWDDVYIEVRFFDQDNKTIDVISTSAWGLTLTPNSKTAFKARGRADRKREDYKEYEITIKSARKKK